MRTIHSIEATVWMVIAAAIATIFYVSSTRNFLIGAVETGTLLSAGAALLIGFTVMKRQAVANLLFHLSTRQVVAAGFFAVSLGTTAALAVAFPGFPWPLGALLSIVLTGGVYAALTMPPQSTTRR